MHALMRSLTVLSLALAVAGASTAAPTPRGHLVLVGGGEKPDDAMAKFVELAGGPEAPIIAIPTASKDDDVGFYYTNLFREKYGCPNVVTLDIKSKADAMREDWADLARQAHGIFFGGGDQIRITNALLGTPVGDAVAAAFAGGAVIGGTSAGTACQSGLMITGEGNTRVIAASSVELWHGLGFFRDVVVDQHFIRRQRANRLLSVVLEHPDLLGVGIDEDTAVWVRPDNTFQVLGASCVMVIDAKRASVSRRASETGQDSLAVHDLKVHVLLAGEQYDIKNRTVIRGPRPAGGRK
jgi:cyanophycinase